MQVLSRLIRTDASLTRAVPAVFASNAFAFGRNLQNAPQIRASQDIDASRSVKTYSTESGGDQPSQPSYQDVSYQQPSSTIRRRPYNLEAKMRMKQYRREAAQRQRAQEIEDEERNFQLDWSKLYKKGDPGTVEGIVRDICTVGYFVKLPSGREGFLPCQQLGCSGGIPLLTRLFKIGDEVTVRVEQMNDGGKDKLYLRKDETLGWAKMAH